MSICPEGEYRDSLTDEEFWNHIAKSFLSGMDIEYEEGEVEEVISAWMNQPCTVCGSTDACSYDSLGRPMIHTEDNSDGDED